ncbi:hypothetical protein EDB87DRAFT_1578760 [Lactarius vividus]|nr:hypothetical protein EDB87DRAFT_1579366 [Lactarius vividus]KAH9057380.1 hypothetical protein EDB87DRAFT_1578760 [Lactarius vividus]
MALPGSIQYLFLATAANIQYRAHAAQRWLPEKKSCKLSDVFAPPAHGVTTQPPSKIQQSVPVTSTTVPHVQPLAYQPPPSLATIAASLERPAQYQASRPAPNNPTGATIDLRLTAENGRDAPRTARPLRLDRRRRSDSNVNLDAPEMGRHRQLGRVGFRCERWDAGFHSGGAIRVTNGATSYAAELSGPDTPARIIIAKPFTPTKHVTFSEKLAVISGPSRSCRFASSSRQIRTGDKCSAAFTASFTHQLHLDLGLASEAEPLVAHAVYEELIKHKDAIEWGVTGGFPMVQAATAEDCAKDKSAFELVKDKTSLGFGWGRTPKEGRRLRRETSKFQSSNKTKKIRY